MELKNPYKAKKYTTAQTKQILKQACIEISQRLAPECRKPDFDKLLERAVMEWLNGEGKRLNGGDFQGHSLHMTKFVMLTHLTRAFRNALKPEAMH